MSEFSCKIDLSNEDDPTAALRHHLGKIRYRLANGDTAGRVLDYNGNAVGHWTTEEAAR